MSSSANSVFRVGRLEIRSSLREVRLEGTLLRLRPKTFDLLVYLLHHSHRVVPKDELLSSLWKGTKVTENSLVQCVIELRKSLNDDARQPRLIQTVAKTGYRFIGTVEESTPETPVTTPLETPVETSSAPSPPAYRRWFWMAGAAVAGLAITVSALPRLLPVAEALPYEVAWWKLDEGTGTQVRDVVGHRTATLSKGVSWTRGVSGTALGFSGSALVVRGGGPERLPRGDAPRTLAAWIKTDSTNADSTAIFQYGDSTPHAAADAFFLMLHESGRAAFGNYYYPVLSRTRVDDGGWHQIAGVFEGGHTRAARIFVDGAAQAQGTVRERLEAGSSSDWTIGRGTWGGTSFRGWIDDIRVYERPLRPAEIQGLYRCVSGAVDLASADMGEFYFASVMGPNAEVTAAPGESSPRVRNAAHDFGGVTFVRRVADCPLGSIRGSDVGQDLTIAVDLRLPSGPAGEFTEGGPYFRSRSSAPGDGIIGGTSAGYWVQLLSTGQVRVKRLHPVAIVAFSQTPRRFDPSVFHRIEVAVNGETLEVALDGRPVTFDQAGSTRQTVQLAPVWETASPAGTNRGSAGIAFSSEAYTGVRIGGQEARNIQLTRYRRLRTGPH